MNLNIKNGTARYNSKILVSDEKFSLRKNDKVNALELTKEAKHTFIPKATIKSHKDSRVVVQLTATQCLPPASLPCTDLAQKPTITHEEKAATIRFLTGAFTIWYMFH